MTCYITNTKTGEEFDVERVQVTFFRKLRWNAVKENAAQVLSESPLVVGNGYTLTIDDCTFTCSVARSGQVDAARSYAFLTAGNGDVLKTPASKHFDGPTLQSIASYLLQQAGETLDTDGSDKSVLQFRFPTYSINSIATIWRQLIILLELVNAVPRFNRDGTVKLVMDSNPSTFVLPSGWHELERNPVTYDLWTETLDTIPEPGQILPSSIDPAQQLIDHVILTVHPDRMTVSVSVDDYSDSSTGYVSAKSISTRSAAATVVKQLPGWKLQVMFDDKSLSANGLSDVPIRYGSPLMTARVKPMTRVSIKFDDAGLPYADGFETNYASEPLTSDEECVFFGNPTKARPLVRANDGVQVFFPSLWKGTITIPPDITGGSFPILISLDTPITPGTDITSVVSSIVAGGAGSPPIPKTNSLGGLAVTATTKLKAE